MQRCHIVLLSITLLSNQENQENFWNVIVFNKKANRAWETKPQARTFFVASRHVLIFAVIGYNTINIDLIESTSKPQIGSNWKPTIFLYWFFIGQYILSFIFTHLINA